MADNAEVEAAIKDISFTDMEPPNVRGKHVTPDRSSLARAPLLPPRRAVPLVETLRSVTDETKSHALSRHLG
jgi:hypothetical protein